MKLSKISLRSIVVSLGILLCLAVPPLAFSASSDASDESKVDLCIERLMQSTERLNYEEASRLVQALGIKSQRDYYQRARSGELPRGLPRAPASAYRGKGWVSWKEFLGTALLSYEKAKALVLAHGIESMSQYVLWSKTANFPKGLPLDPESAYAKKGWISRDDFFSVKRISFTLDEIKAGIKQYSFEKSLQYREWARSPENVMGYPIYPEHMFKNKGWLGWDDFLGKPTKTTVSEQPKAPRFYDYFEAQAHAIHNELTTRNLLNQWFDSPEADSRVPRAPWAVYKDMGWVDLPTFLNTNGDKLPEETVVHLLKLSGIESEREDGGYTFSQDQLYVLIDDKWLDLRDIIKADNRKYDHDRAVMYMLNRGLRAAKDFNSWKSEGSRPLFIPSHPQNFYEDKGWVSWDNFLSVKRHITVSRASSDSEVRSSSTPKLSEPDLKPEAVEDSLLLSEVLAEVEIFEEVAEQEEVREEPVYRPLPKYSYDHAQAVALFFGIESLFDLSQLRDARMPAEPMDHYSDGGWVDEATFFNTNGSKLSSETMSKLLEMHGVEPPRGKEKFKFSEDLLFVRQNRGWVDIGQLIDLTTRPFDLDRAGLYLRSQGVNDEEGFLRLRASGQLPEFIPLEPERFYADLGWQDWENFVGEKGHREMSFEGAWDLMKELTFDSGEEFNRWLLSEDRPARFPLNPERVYRNEGWTSWEDFLGLTREQLLASSEGGQGEMSFQELKVLLKIIDVASLEDIGVAMASGGVLANFSLFPQLEYEPEWQGWEELIQALHSE